MEEVKQKKAVKRKMKVSIPAAENIESVKEHLENVAVAEEKTEQQKVEEFMKNPENKQKAIELANQIQKIVGKNWFSLNELVRKSSETKMSAYQKLQLCKMFTLAQTKTGDYRDGIKNLRQPLFKITISLENQIAALDDIILYYTDQIKDLQIQKKILQDILEKSKPKLEAEI